MQMQATERRLDKRVVIPGAKVKYRLENGENGSSKLENLSSNSASIQIKSRVLSGQPIEIELIIANIPVILLKAKIVWVLSRGGYEEGSNVGIQFRPFGNGERENAPNIQEQLEKVVKEYQ